MFIDFLIAIKDYVLLYVLGLTLVVWRVPSALRMADRLWVQIVSLLIRKNYHNNVSYVDIVKNYNLIQIELAVLYGYLIPYEIDHIILGHTHNGNPDEYGNTLPDKYSDDVEFGYTNVFLYNNQSVDIKEYLHIFKMIDENGYFEIRKKELNLVFHVENLQSQFVYNHWEQVLIFGYKNKENIYLSLMTIFLKKECSDISDIINIIRERYFVINAILNDKMSEAYKQITHT